MVLDERISIINYRTKSTVRLLRISVLSTTTFFPPSIASVIYDFYDERNFQEIFGLVLRNNRIVF